MRAGIVFRRRARRAPAPRRQAPPIDRAACLAYYASSRIDLLSPAACALFRALLPANCKLFTFRRRAGAPNDARAFCACVRETPQVGDC